MMCVQGVQLYKIIWDPVTHDQLSQVERAMHHSGYAQGHQIIQRSAAAAA